MIPFDWPLFRRVVRIAFSPPPGAPRPGFFGGLRIALNLAAYLALEAFNAFCLLLDDVFFPGYRRVQLEPPVFIIGNPRSGTTFLHRVMSRDDRFFVFKTWELLFPSVLQKKVGALLGAIDRALGSPVFKISERIKNRMLGTFQDLHPTGLFVPEEDEMLFLHCFSTLYLIFFFRARGELIPFADFDRNIDARRRATLMAYYRSCLQRQAYARGPGKVFLSKNPMFGGKIATLHESFPGARFVYCVRNPLDAIPSMLSEGWATCVYAPAGTNPPAEFQEDVYAASQVFYRRPLEFMAAHPAVTAPVVVFRDLVKAPRAAVTALYGQLGLTLTDTFQRVLDEEDRKSRGYVSSHKYDLAHFTIPAERIVADLGELFDRFGFAREKKKESSATAGT